jgi:hypothetical protein
MAESWKGWQGEKVWQSLEGELRIACSVDALGHVKASVTILAGLPRRWEVHAVLYTESGALDGLAREAEAFQNALETAA